MGNLFAELRKSCEVCPDKTLYLFLNGDGSVRESCTYDQFLGRVRNLACGLKQARIGHFGEPVLLAYPQGIEMLVAFFACVHLGAIPVPVPAPEAGAALSTGLERLKLIQQDCGASTAITSSPALARMFGNTVDNAQAGSHPTLSKANLNWFSSEAISQLTTKTLEDETSFDQQQILFLQYTSGSTQRPRGVIVSHDNVLHNCRSAIQTPLIVVSWLPQFHDMGLIAGCLCPAIVRGTAILFSSVDFLRRPAFWFETMTRYHATGSVAPNFAFEYCLREDKIPNALLSSFDLRSVRELVSGSEPVHCDSFQKFRERFAVCGLSKDALQVAYGLAENTLRVSWGGRVVLHLDRRLLQQHQLRIDRSGIVLSDPFRLVSAGKPIEGVEVRIVDPEKRLDLGENSIGEIWICGESKALGYWNNPDQTREVFQAIIENDPERHEYLRTGDIGFLHEGELYVCSRIKDLIIVRGRNFYPQDIEAVVQQYCSTVRPGSVVCFSIQHEHGDEQVVVLIETRARNPIPDLCGIAREIRRQGQLDVGIVAVVDPRSIARTSSGKVARSETRRRWLAGEITTICQHHQNLAAVTDEALNFLLHGSAWDDAEDRTLAELGIDSLTLVNISLEIRRHMQNLGLPEIDEFGDLTMLQAFTLRELRDMIQVAQQQGKSWRPDLAEISCRLRSVEAAEKEQMKRDAVLPDDVLPSAGPSPVAGSENVPSTVLLTGCTGFLGSFLLERLLSLSAHRVAVVVRAQDENHARSRVHAALRRTGLLTEYLESQAETRVEVICGDLDKPRLDLTSSQWDKFSTQVSSIYHCGTNVDYIKPYASLRSTNVGSTLELLRLASSGPLKRFHLVSSTFIFGWSGTTVLYETDCNPEMSGLNFGYSQSKWTAEQLVQQAAGRGLPVSIYRPSLVTASLKSRYSRSDIMARTMIYMIRHGICTDCSNQLSFLPVDIVANNIIAISLADRSEFMTTHMTVDDYYNMPDVASVITRDFGYSLPLVSLTEFIDHINKHCRPDEPLFPLVPFFNRNYRRIEHMKDKRYDNRNYRRLRMQTTACLPEPSMSDTVSAMVKYLQQESLIPQPEPISMGQL